MNKVFEVHEEKTQFWGRLSREGKIRLFIGCAGLISAALYYSVNTCLQ